MKIQGVRLQGTKLVPSGAAADEYFNLVSLLLPGNGTNGAQNNTFLDSSTNNFTVTRNGTPTQGTFSPFSQTGWSNYLNGSSYFTAPGSTAFAFGTGAFTIEMWLYVTAYPANYAVIPSNRPYNAGSTDTWGVFFFNDGAVRFSDVNNTQTFQTSAGAVPLNAWTHLAVVRNSTASNDTKIYINGTSVAQGTINSNFANNTNAVVFGTSYDSNNWYVTSYASNLRIVKGTAVYTSNFTPSTTALTNISGTSLLTCQSNRFVDNSTNAFAITVNGNTAVQAFAPFDPTAAYSAATVGGSGYFDGSSDHLLVAASTGSWGDFGTGDFTIEAWIYTPALSALQGICGAHTGGQNDTWQFRLNGSTLELFGANGQTCAATTAVSANQWVFVTASRSGANAYLGVNGTVNTVAITAGVNGLFSATSGGNVSVANLYSTPSAHWFTGYISNLRIRKGTAAYTSSFTPPTAALTAISNTQLLLNYTNGGITDAAAKNVLETVGGAAISTAQSKFGGSSMAFDGNGDYLQAPNTVNANFGSGNFTIEFWMYASSQALAPIVHQTSYASNQGWIVWNYDGVTIGASTRKLTFMFNGASFSLTTSSDAYADNTWTHIAVVKNGTGANNIKIYSNGSQIAAGTYSTAVNNATTPFMVGGIINGVSWNGTTYYNGYLDDLRVTTGLARYTANFTPPTAAFPVQ